MIVLQRSRGWSYREIAQAVRVAKGTVGEVLKRWKQLGTVGLIDRREDNGEVKADEDFLAALWEVLQGTAQDYGWPRPTWTIELLILTLARKAGVQVSRSTMSRALQKHDGPAQKSSSDFSTACTFYERVYHNYFNRLARRHGR